MFENVNTSIATLGDVLSFMAPFAGGAVPSEGDDEYANWVLWVQNAQEEFAKRGFWRRCLAREEVTLDDGYTTVLPNRFHKPNGLYMCIVDGVDWMDPNNSDEQNIFIEMVNDPESDDFVKWQMRFLNELTEETDAILWYFANPPKPTDTADKLLLPGDMVGFGALINFARGANQEGSEDRFEDLAENRFQEYLSLEVIPAKNELLKFSDSDQSANKVDYLKRARTYYQYRTGRTRQG